MERDRPDETPRGNPRSAWDLCESLLASEERERAVQQLADDLEWALGTEGSGFVKMADGRWRRETDPDPSAIEGGQL